jgi:hypothetical protein
MSSFPKLLLSLVDGLRFGQANICKHSIVKFQQCFALPRRSQHQIASATQWDTENARERRDFARLVGAGSLVVARHILLAQGISRLLRERDNAWLHGSLPGGCRKPGIPLPKEKTCGD